MSTVTNGKITTNDQKVDKSKFDSNYDDIKWKTKQPDRKAQDGEKS